MTEEIVNAINSIELMKKSGWILIKNKWENNNLVLYFISLKNEMRMRTCTFINNSSQADWEWYDKETSNDIYNKIINDTITTNKTDWKWASTNE